MRFRVPRRVWAGVGVVVAFIAVAAAPAHAIVIPGGVQWSARYDGPPGRMDEGQVVAVTPDGATAVVAGYSSGGHGLDYATVAYDASTGAVKWSNRYDGTGHGTDEPRGIAVSPDGTKVAVTGQSWGATGDYDYATIVYDVATGNQVWRRRYDGDDNNDDEGFAVQFTPDSKHVIVTGSSDSSTTASDFATISYNAFTGGQNWVKLFDGKAHSIDNAFALDISADGSNVVVVGATRTSGVTFDYMTIDYATSNGQVQWKRWYDSLYHENDLARAVAVSPDDSFVVVTGDSSQPSSVTQPRDYFTIAYNMADGSVKFRSRYNGAADLDDQPTAVVVSPDNNTAFVTGFSGSKNRGSDIATLAVNTTNGALRWHDRYDGAAHVGDFGNGIAVSPNGSRVVVTGESDACQFGSACDNMVTISYDASSGAQPWATIFNGTGNDKDVGYAVAITPDSTSALVTGVSVGTAHPAPNGEDMYTVRYKL
jgi:DNA-binding beta-propeller fold protein YncE